MLKTAEEIINWLDKMEINYYEIDDDLTVNVDGTVDLSGKNLYNLPVQFGEINGDFAICSNPLTSLKGSPSIVNGNFLCCATNLRTLKYSPIQVLDEFDCSNCELSSLAFSPKLVGGDFKCSGNFLENLIGAPETVGGDFSCELNPINDLYGFTTDFKGSFIHHDKVLIEHMKEFYKDGRLTLNCKELKTIINYQIINVDTSEKFEANTKKVKI